MCLLCLGHKFKTLVCAVLCKIVRKYLIWNKNIYDIILCHVIEQGLIFLGVGDRTQVSTLVSISQLLTDYLEKGVRWSKCLKRPLRVHDYSSGHYLSVPKYVNIICEKPWFFALFISCSS
jgi:hypothetical protein